MIEFMLRRREELRTHPQSAGTTPLQPIPKPSIAITPGKKK